MLTINAFKNLVGFFSLIVLVSGKNTKAALDTIKLDDILSNKYRVLGYSGSWVSDYELQTYDSSRNLVNLNVNNQNVSTIFNASKISSNADYKDGYSLRFSDDKNYVAIVHQEESVWRHSTRALYDIYDIQTERIQKIRFDNSTEKSMLFQWAPTGNSFAVVFENNIYYCKTATNATQLLKITSDGSVENGIFNGHSDWVYEEEMFGSGTALWFSPDSNYLSFVRFDDSKVQEFQYPHYGESGDLLMTYPKWTTIRYPKAGAVNPEVVLKIVNLNSTNPSGVSVTYPNGSPIENRHYIAKVVWLTRTKLFIQHLNRNQNNSTWFKCDTNSTTFACSNIGVVTESNGWIDAIEPFLKPSGESDEFLTVQYSKFPNENDTYKQIIWNEANGNATNLLKAKISVNSIIGWDTNKNKIYFSGTGHGVNGTDPDPSETHIYEISTVGNSSNLICITCDLKNNQSKPCRSNSARFSHNFTYFVHSCSGPDVPETNVRLNDPNNYAIKWPLEINKVLNEQIKNAALPLVRDYSITVVGLKRKIRARLYLPPDFDESKKYPLLIDVYGGPDSQKINQAFSVSWGTSLVSDRKIIYGFIDGRGSGQQTKEWVFELYKNLGTLEIEDQISAVKFLMENNQFIDKNRTAIWGWSYGGYATSMVMAKDSENIFKCGISVAPVTSWRYYDSIYTERYMGLPESVGSSYNTSEVTTMASSFKNKTFFLVHGNADDNVHYQNSMILARALEKADVVFNQLSYPDEDHSINSPGMRKHLYHSLENFLFRDCFNPDFAEQKNSGSTKTNFGLFFFTSYTLLILTYFY